MEIVLNGVPQQLTGALSVQALLTDLYVNQPSTSLGTASLPQQGLAVAVNREVVPRRQWSLRILCAGDKVDIVRAIGGG